MRPNLAQLALRKFCEELHPDKHIDAAEDDIPAYVRMKNYGRVYREPTTGATLTYEFALVVLQNFVSRLVSIEAKLTTLEVAPLTFSNSQTKTMRISRSIML